MTIRRWSLGKLKKDKGIKQPLLCRLALQSDNKQGKDNSQMKYEIFTFKKKQV